MTRLRGALRRRRLAALAVLAGLGALTYSLVAGAATPIPVPDPLVVVTTKSGTVTKTHYVPIGGAPVPIDVDGQPITGLIEPDIDVSVGLVSLPELPNVPIPNVVVRRNALALATDRPNPPLDIDARIVLRDANDGLKPLVEVHYGFATPPGGRIPPVVEARLVGPVQGGFVDPLQAKILSPGYSGPLNFKISALTEDLDAKFALNFDALPESIFVSEDPREDGLDVLYTHNAPVADVHLDAFATLRNRQTDELLEVGANIERLPQRIELSNTNTIDTTHVTYDSSSALNKPDVEAVYRDRDGDGKLITDVNAKVAGLPFSMEGTIGTVPTDDGGSKLDSADFRVLDGEEIESIDFLVRNWEGPAGPVPAPKLWPQQHVAVASRFVDGETRTRVAGRILGIRSATFDLQGPNNDIIDATTDIGNGVDPLRAVLDIDDRPDPSVADEDDQWLKVDSTLTPLPESIHFRYEPSPTPADPLRLLYESSRSMDVDALATIAKGGADGCGFAEVTCVKARVDDVPRTLEALLPGEDGTDFSVRHDGTAVSDHPDVTATVDSTDDEGERTWANVRIDRVPPAIDGRLDTKLGVLKSAEFHGCDYDFADNACDSPATADALGRVRFTVRDQPERGALPPKEDTAKQFVSLISRDERFEASGRVDEVRNVVFHQRDDDEDGEADGTLGALVDAGTGQPFDAVIDDVSDYLDPDDETEPFTVLGKGSTKMRIGVAALPQEFSACVRENNDDEAPPVPSSLSPDPLLAPCDRDDVLGRSSGDLEVTPLSILYTASSKTKVSARIESENPDKDDPVVPATNPVTYNRSASVFATTVDKVPDEIRTDVISPQTPDPDATPAIPGRKLEMDYDASERIDRIDFEMEARRAGSLCEDPRPNRRATCLSAVVTDLPDDIFVSYDPDKLKGDIEFITAPPKESNGDSCTNGTDDDGDGFNDATDPDCVKLSINKSSVPDPMRLSIVEPETTSQPLVLDARITDITDHLKGKLISKDVDGEAGLGPSRCFNNIDDDTDVGDSGGGIDAADDDCEADLAQMVFNACPTGSGVEDIASGCPGIGRIEFKATNSLVGDPLPQPNPLTSSIPGVTQDFSFVQREDLFRAQGVITALKKIGLSQVDKSASANPSATTRISAAFGTGSPTEKIRAYVDTDSGAEQLLADAVIAEAPAGIDVCLRDAIPSGSDFTQNASSDVFCDTAANNQFALQAALTTAATGDKPDIDVRQLRVASGGGTSVLTGTAKIDNLGERIDVLAGKQDADGDILVEGHSLGDDNHAPSTSDPDNVADRVTFNLRNRDADPSGGSQYPWRSLENSDPNPVGAVSTTDVDSPAGLAANNGNFLKFMTDAAGRFVAKGSVPDIKRIAKRKGACDPSDPRFPDPTTGFPATKVPEYSCLIAQAAGNSKLGLGVRTLDAKNEVLEVEEGLVTAVPSGGLKVSLGKSPDAAKLDPICSSTQAAPCRPPMLSVEAPRGGAAVPNLQARLSTGNKNLIVGKLLREAPSDAVSQSAQAQFGANGLFEQAPSAFPEDGARVKVGTDKAGNGDELLGIRMNANLPLRQFLDLDPPTLWSCKHTVPNPDPVSQCAATDAQASSDANQGYESKDIFFKLVAADNHHDGSDVPFLGRVAVLVQDYKPGGTETVLTGAPSPDNKTWFTKRAGTDFAKNDPTEPATGADSHFPENFTPPTDAAHRGFRVPGHMDAKVYLRNDYNSPGDDDKQQNFAQVDGRVNAPLTMAVRLNDELKSNRAGQSVAGTQLTIRNGPSSNGTDNYSQPTMRVRAELKKGHVDNSDPGLAEKIFTCDGAGYGIQIPALLTVCLLVPTQSEAQWLDVGLNMDPASNGTTTSGNPARTVDAVAGPFGGSNDADLRGFSQVNGTGGDGAVNKGAGAPIVPQAGLRLTNFNIGLKVGAGIGLIGGSVTWVEEGDLIVGLTGHENDRARLNHNLLVMRLTGGTNANPNQINSNLKSIFRFKLTVEVLFGLAEGDVINETVGPFHHQIVFRDCAGDFFALGGTNDEFRQPSPNLGGGDKAAIAFGSTGDLGGDLAASLNNVLVGIASQIFCLFSTSDSKDVNSGHPAPRYNVTQRGVENGPGPAAGSAPSDPPDTSQDPEPQNVTIGANTTRCGTIQARKFTVNSGVTLRVGREGEFDAVTGVPCAGNLNIASREAEIDGTVDAVGARTTTAGPGAGTGVGGGAGHHGVGGGRGGTNLDGGPALPGPSTAPPLDFGSAGSNGTAGANGGRGGGTVVITALQDIVVDGSILARGSAGGTAPNTSCEIGGGGGSGGAISLSGARVVGGGLVSVSGGSGGAAARGGGGGSAGRITVNSVVKGATGGLFFANGGSGGSGAQDCFGDASNDTGFAGSAGLGGPANPPAGTTLDRAAFVELHGDNPGPFVKGSVKLRLRGVEQPPSSPFIPDSVEDDMDIVLCRKYLAPANTQAPFEDPALDPGTDTLDQRLTNSTCTVEDFSAPTSGNDTFERTVTVNLPQDGFYSWTAMAADHPLFGIVPIGGQNYCAEVHGFFEPDCDYQSPEGSGGDNDVSLVAIATAKIGSDTTAPSYDTAAANRPLNGFAGCPDSSLCLSEPKMRMKVEAHDSTSGIKSITCDVNGGAAQPCGPAPSVELSPTAGDGLKSVNMRLEDNADDPPETAGNVANLSDVAKWFVDRTKPNQPVVTLSACSGGNNGWCTSIPSISASGSDNNPSSGFNAGALTVLVDESGNECGSAAAGSSSGAGTTSISCPSGTVAVTQEGRHVISAFTTDRLGNESDRAVNKVMKVDSTAPVSKMALGPKKPDGAEIGAAGKDDNWYRTRPFYAFAATDKAGGSGVDPDIGTSGIYYSVNGNAFQKFDPNADLRLPDGIHEICWYAEDVAGNEEANGDPKAHAPSTNCQANIKVDSTAPTINDPISPSSPDGDNGWYKSTPTIDADANDPVAVSPPGGTVSGVAKEEIELDGGDWTTAMPTQIAEGEHVVRTRAFDVAGNPSPILERRIFVDKTGPSARMVSYPPRPNDQGWFRRHVQDAISASDGRDGSGADGATYEVDAEGPISYLTPFTVTDGDHAVKVQARDLAGLKGPVDSRQQRVDTVAPYGAPVGRTPTMLLPAIGLPTAVPLVFTASDQYTPRVRVRVFVYDALGNVVRRIDAPGPHPGGYRDPGQGSVSFNGRTDYNQGVLPGLYHYRVHVIDQAGNTVLSDESPPFVVVLGVLPRLGVLGL